jgi:hypothetical protein
MPINGTLGDASRPTNSPTNSPIYAHQNARTQQKVSAKSLVQSYLAWGFHATICSGRTPNLAAMPSQVSPHCTK